MKKLITNILMVVCLCIALGCGGYLLYYYYGSYKSETQVADLKSMVESDTEETDTEQATGQQDMVTIDGVRVQKKFSQIYKENSDFLGWLTIEDTNIDYPVMYTPNDGENGEHYIHLDFEEQYSAAGLPFMDENCSVTIPTDNVIIYGHNMKSGKMFHDLLKYAEQDFYEEHKTFQFDTIYGDGEYEVVAAFYAQILPEESTEFKYYTFVNAGTKEEFLSYVDNIKKMSCIDTNVDVTYGDKLLTLSTCAYHVKDGRFAVIARRISK